MNHTITSLLALLLLQVSFSFADRYNKELDDHFSRVDDFPCHEPRPRAFSVADLLPDHPPGRRYQPAMTVLHRCDPAAGCCQGGDVCGVESAEDVDLPFLVTLAEGEDFTKHPMGRTIIDYYKASNHTRCKCYKKD